MTGLLDDPAYQFELEKMDSLCRDYLTARADSNSVVVLLLLGMMTAQHAAIYKLSPPAGILDPADLFRREEVDPGV